MIRRDAAAAPVFWRFVRAARDIVRGLMMLTTST